MKKKEGTTAGRRELEDELLEKTLKALALDEGKKVEYCLKKLKDDCFPAGLQVCTISTDSKIWWKGFVMEEIVAFKRARKYSLQDVSVLDYKIVLGVLLEVAKAKGLKVKEIDADDATLENIVNMPDDEVYITKQDPKDPHTLGGTAVYGSHDMTLISFSSDLIILNEEAGERTETVGFWKVDKKEVRNEINELLR